MGRLYGKVCLKEVKRPILLLFFFINLRLTDRGPRRRFMLFQAVTAATFLVNKNIA